MPSNRPAMDDLRRKRMAIAVVGIGALFPGADNAGEFWRNIISGRDLVTEVPPTHWIIEDHYHSDPSVPDKTYCKRGAFLSPTDFDPLAFRIPPADLSSTDTSQLLGLKVAEQVLEDAARGPMRRMARDRISVILGVASGLELLGEMNSRLQRPAWAKALRESGIPDGQAADICDRIARQYTPWKESTFPGLLGNVVAGRIAGHFDLGGTNCTVDAACASSFSAMSMAVNELCLGLADLVITGGVDTTNGPFLHTCFSKTPALSPTGDCRPFSDGADGVVIGEGIGMVALKRLEDAERDGDRIYAVIRGIGTSSDGAGKSVFAPLRDGQEKALRRCYEMAGYAPETVALVEAHGTGTVTGDRVEFEALRRVFDGKERRKRQWCALGSIKSQIGHTKSAAGAAGLIKAVLALHNRVLAPTIKVDRPDPGLDLDDSPFYLNTKARPWIASPSHPPRASVSAFGFGGTNFHVAVEAYTGAGKQVRRQRAFPGELVLLGAEDEAALLARCREAAARAQTPGMLAFIAHSSQKAFHPKASARLAIVAADEKDLERKIHRAVALISKRSGQSHACDTGIDYCSSATPSGALAFLFPGHGHRYLGMGADAAMHLEAARAIWERAAAIPMEEEGLRLHDIVFPHPVFSDKAEKAQQRRIGLSRWAQPAVSTMSLSLLAVLERFGIVPDCVGGHGSGEITALCAGGVLEAVDLIQLARKRGACMAGSGIDAHPPPVSSAQHTGLGEDTRAPFRAYLDSLSFNAPDRPVYSTIDAAPYPGDAVQIRQRLVGQMDPPDGFAEVVEAMYANGVRMFVEVGPGAALTERVGRILDRRPHVAVNTDRRDENGINRLWSALGRLAIHGRSVDFSPMWEGYPPVTDPRLKQTSAFSVPLLGCNYDRPYPPCTGTDRGTSDTDIDPAAADPTKPSSEQPEMEQSAMTHPKKPESNHPLKPSPPSPSQGSIAPDTPVSTHGVSPCKAAPPPKGDGRMAAWINAFVETQRQTAEAHSTFQRSLTESHLAFLSAAEMSTRALGGMIANSPQGPPPMGWNKEGPGDYPTAEPLPAPLFEPATASASQKSMAVESPAKTSEIPESSPHTAERATPPVAAHLSEGAPPPESVTPDPKTLLFDVVAQKTGYPEEVLNTRMNLESDLGIDSIKRVEILSAVTDRMPDLPEVDTARLAELQTLGDVLAHMQTVSGDPADEPPPGASLHHRPMVSPPGQRHGTEPVRYALREVPAPHSGISMAEPLLTGFCAVTDDGAGIAHALARQLTEMGADAQVVADVPDSADSVIFLGGLRDCPDPASAMAVNREAFSAARSVSRRFAAAGGFFATVQDTGGDFGLGGGDESRAWLAGLPGLIKTAAIEWPQAALKAIDVERSGRSADELARIIGRELIEGGPEIEVGLHADGRRIRLESYPSPLERRYPMLDERSVLVVSGGARGVTAAALVELAKRFQPKLALLGRTVLSEEPACCRGAVSEGALKRAFAQAARAEGQPGTPAQMDRATRQVLAQREIRTTVRALEAAGSQVCYLNADIRDAAAVGSVLGAVRRKWGPITGIVHGAGVIRDKPIAEKTPSMFDTVFDTKVLGLYSLLTATAGDPLEMICLFSSVAARLGNPGQCDYAMANEVLNKVAHAQARRRNHTCAVKSVNWGPWEGGMVSGALKAHFEQAGVPLIPLDVGARLFVDEIQAAPSDAVEVAIASDPGAPGLERGGLLGAGPRQ